MTTRTLSVAKLRELYPCEDVRHVLDALEKKYGPGDVEITPGMCHYFAATYPNEMVWVERRLLSNSHLAVSPLALIHYAAAKLRAEEQFSASISMAEEIRDLCMDVAAYSLIRAESVYQREHYPWGRWRLWDWLGLPVPVVPPFAESWVGQIANAQQQNAYDAAHAAFTGRVDRVNRDHALAIGTALYEALTGDTE